MHVPGSQGLHTCEGDSEAAGHHGALTKPFCSCVFCQVQWLMLPEIPMNPISLLGSKGWI